MAVLRGEEARQALARAQRRARLASGGPRTSSAQPSSQDVVVPVASRCGPRHLDRIRRTAGRLLAG